MLDWEQVRLDFPVTERVVYLNSAAAGPVPRPVMEAATGYYREMMEEGDARWDEWLERREIVRRRIAQFINAEPDEIALTTNTSSGMNTIVDALEGRGDVISCNLEFPVSTITWLHRGINVKLIEAVDGELRIEDVRRAMNEKTAIICLSHVQYSNGFRSNLEELGNNKSNHAWVVNASQSAGAFEIDVKRMRIDALCATGHKWMLSGYGSGFVYLSRKLLDERRARAIGWLSVEEPFGDRNRYFKVRADAAARIEWGCPHFAGIFALGAAVDYLLQIGTHEIEQRVLALNRHLTGRLADEGWRVLSPLRNESSRSGETLVAAERPKRVVAHLARRGIAITEKPEGIRVATHFFNNEADIERLMVALNEMRA
ncbi:MAG: cysteine desulfurase / selenocysteine lyase [Acidobacteriota bacterium]|jgi:selenocysteine lyase/cysteine desulfurase|nr:cysteine desulfurase / selenocysteine lyase [Acidobacteriota bacterium]